MTQVKVEIRPGELVSVPRGSYVHLACTNPKSQHLREATELLQALLYARISPAERATVQRVIGLIKLGARSR
jgi:hypothetical protein